MESVQFFQQFTSLFVPPLPTTHSWPHSFHKILPRIIGFRDSGRDTGRANLRAIRLIYSLANCVDNAADVASSTDRAPRSLVTDYQSFQLRLRFSVAAQHYRLSRRMERWKGPRDAFLPADPSSQRCILARVIYNFIVTEPGPREWLMIAAHEGEGFLAIFI